MIFSFEDWITEKHPEMSAEVRDRLGAAIATIPDLIWEYVRDLVSERITDLMDSERRRYIQ